ncbi:MAG: universal stress protein [Rhodospirillales bacterium]|jgi:nucleotide-binding universal stress UspA family protein|nr:universal stress protein [Rhodospirillales bacterium]MBT4005565.1 universal stress protein [Rhodospirillales bacterium]MBT5076313.1 universal stress protein [Rhodospirillales bacterium]MBT5112284.1 universal stress protein [Rhodospirillales bacterium]MBT5671985.1 universal stress protein [Rhodospirillales bacterium]
MASDENIQGTNTSSGPDEQERIFLVVVDATEEHHKALRFACRRARHTGGRVAMFYVIEPAEFQHWMAVEDLMQEERREEAEAIFHHASADVQALSGKTPAYYLRAGKLREELLKLVDEEKSISVLVLAAASGTKGPGPLVMALGGKSAGELPIPVTIVPGNLSDEEIDALT